MNSKFSELERATLAVLAIFKTIPEIQTAKVAVIGGMALWKYLPNYRTTQVLISDPGSPWPLLTVQRMLTSASRRPEHPVL